MPKEYRPPKFAVKFARIVLKTILFILLFVVLIFALLLTAPVQRILTAKVQHYLENKLHTKVRVERIAFGLSGKVSLRNIYMEDKTGDTLVSGDAINARINFLKLFSGEVRIKDLELYQITAKIKRQLPDTVFNFQFIVDAFSSPATKKTNSNSSGGGMKLNINNISLNDINVTYADVVTGNDVFAHIGEFTAAIDSIDLMSQRFVIPSIIIKNSIARVKQKQPLVKGPAKPAETAQAHVQIKLQLSTVDLENVYMDYGDEVAALYTIADIGRFMTKSNDLDLQQDRIDLAQITMDHSRIAVRMGKRQTPNIIKPQQTGEVAGPAEMAWNISVSRINMDDNTFQFDDDNVAKLANGIDYSHIAAKHISLAADSLSMTPGSVAVNVTGGALTEKSGLKIEDLRGEALYANNQSYLRNLYIKTPGTEIKKTIVLNYASLADLSKHPGQVSAEIDLAQSWVQVKDILLFIPQLRANPAFHNPNDVWRINLVGNGSMNQFNIQSLQFAGLNNTQVDAHGTLRALTNLKKAGCNFTISSFHSTHIDMAVLAGGAFSNKKMDLPDDFTLSGTIHGRSGAFNAGLHLITSDGSVAIAGRFADLTDPGTMVYNGVITTNNLQVGKILKQPGVGPLSAKIMARGKGVTPTTINTIFSASITSAGYNNYQYHGIALSGSLHKTNFELSTSIKDPDADANISVTGNFSNHPAFSITGMIDSIKAQPLHLSSKPLIVRCKLEGSASNITADNITAHFLVTQALLVSGDNRLSLDTVQLSSGKNDTADYIRLNSPIVNASVTGEYRLADLGNIVQNAVDPYFSTSGVKKKPDIPYHVHLTADATYQPILSTLVPGLDGMQALHLSGNFSSSNGLDAGLVIPSISFHGNNTTDLKIAAITSETGLQLSANIGHLKSGSSLDIYNAQLDVTALNNAITFRFGVGDPNGKRKYFLAGTVNQPSPGSYAVQLEPDSLLLNYQHWKVTPGNEVLISPQHLRVQKLALQEGDQRLSINSPVSGDSQSITLGFTNFRLATITGFARSDSILADGLINGNITAANFMKQPQFAGNLTINDLILRNDTVGNLTIRAATSGPDKYELETSISGKGNDVALTGEVSMAANNTNLDLLLNMRALQLRSLQSIMPGAIQNASGAVSGSVSIGGNTSRPVILGDLIFNKASFALTMLGSQFHLDNQKLSVNNDGLSFANFTIKDSSGNALALNGTVLTSNFINYQFNLKLTAQNFQLLNSTKKQNPIYYGKMKISTNISITGTETKPVVDGKITVDDGTALNFVVPQPDQGVEERDGIVQFVDMRNPANDTLFMKYDSLNRSSVSGMDIALNIQVKKEAVFNIVVDEANGDFLNAQGEADLTAGIDPSGKISLTGNYTLDKGAYQLSFNFLQRKFKINRGSTITWTGEPTSAKLNIGAVYIANTAPIDLVQDQIEGSSASIRNTYLQKLPFEVHLDLTGELMKPVVSFAIELPENKNYGVSNDVVTTVQYKLTQLKEDPGETNKQVFSLLLLNRFVGENPFASAGGGGFNAGSYARQSASKLLTEQLNQLAANLINGVDVNFDVASTEDYTTGSMRNRTDLNLNLSKRLLNDRLKISVGSDFELEGPQNSNQQSNNIAGDVAVDYQLSRDGRYFIRFFRKNDYEGEIDGYVIENGLSFIITIDYNRFMEIWRHRKQKSNDADKKQKKPAQ